MMTRFVLLLLLAVVGAGCGPQTTPTAVADINAVVDRFWNRQLTVVGQVTAVQADPIGTSRGYYLLVDETDRNGIRVSSRNLPAPGQELYVTGTVVQNPNDARMPLLQEIERSAVSVPWLQYVMYASGALAVVLLGTLLVTVLRPPQPTPAPAPSIHPPFEPAPYRPRFIPEEDDATKPYTPPEDDTQAFNYWGFEVQVEEGPDAGRAVPIGTTPFLIGRSGGRQNHMQLNDRTVSRSQAAIRRHPKTGVFTVEHQGGTNETIVEGKPVDVAELRDGNRIRCGATVLVFHKDGHA